MRKFISTFVAIATLSTFAYADNYILDAETHMHPEIFKAPIESLNKQKLEYRVKIDEETISQMRKVIADKNAEIKKLKTAYKRSKDKDAQTEAMLLKMEERLADFAKFQNDLLAIQNDTDRYYHTEKYNVDSAVVSENELRKLYSALLRDFNMLKLTSALKYEKVARNEY